MNSYSALPSVPPQFFRDNSNRIPPRRQSVESAWPFPQHPHPGLDDKISNHVSYKTRKRTFSDAVALPSSWDPTFWASNTNNISKYSSLCILCRSEEHTSE